MFCGNCTENDGFIYTSLPPKVKCKITGQFRFCDDICNVKDEPIISEDIKDEDCGKEVDEAVRMLKKEYRKAVQLSFVNDPLAYSLYQVWKKYDGRYKDVL